MKFALGAVVLLVAASAATYVRYESFDPCDWLEQDMLETGYPRVVVSARVRTLFLFRGITDPTVSDCLSAWWRYRSEEIPEES